MSDKFQRGRIPPWEQKRDKCMCYQAALSGVGMTPDRQEIGIEFSDRRNGDNTMRFSISREDADVLVKAVLEALRNNPATN